MVSAHSQKSGQDKDDMSNPLQTKTTFYSRHLSLTISHSGDQRSSHQSVFIQQTWKKMVADTITHFSFQESLYIWIPIIVRLNVKLLNIFNFPDEGISLKFVINYQKFYVLQEKHPFSRGEGVWNQIQVVCWLLYLYLFQIYAIFWVFRFLRLREHACSYFLFLKNTVFKYHYAEYIGIFSINYTLEKI